MIRKRVATIAVLVTFFSVGGPASAGVAPEPVVTGKTDQFGPGAEGDTWVGWTQLVKPTFTAHIRMQDGSQHQKLHRREGSHSFFGGFDPDSDDVLFQDAKGLNSNLYLYHELTDTFGAPPDGINTELWEWGPDISTSFILFGRNRFDRGSSLWRVILYDRALETFDVLASVENRCGCIWPEAVNERYAAWTKCEARCHVFVYDTQDDTRTRVPNPDKQQYAAALSDEGDVYFVRSGNSCDANPRIMRYTLDTDAMDVVFAYPDGRNLVSGLDLVDGVTGDDLYFDQASCGDRRYRGNIYRISDIVTPTLLAPEFSGVDDASAGAWKRPQRPGARPIG